MFRMWSFTTPYERCLAPKLEGQGFTGCGKTRLACHSEESAILIGGRRGISHCVENTQSEIPRSARNDSLEEFFRSLFSPAARIWPFGVTLSLCLSSFAYSWHIFRPLLDAFWVRFLGTFVDSKGLLRFVPSDLTSFVNFLRVSGTLAAALLEHPEAGIGIGLTSRGSSVMKISPTSLASQGR